MQYKNNMFKQHILLVHRFA